MDIYLDLCFHLVFSVRCNVDGETAGFLPMEKRMRKILFHLFYAAMVVLILLFFCRCCCCNKKSSSHTVPQPLPPAQPQTARRQRKSKASRTVIIVLFVILLQVILFFMDGPGSRFWSLTKTKPWWLTFDNKKYYFVYYAWDYYKLQVLYYKYKYLK